MNAPVTWIFLAEVRQTLLKWWSVVGGLLLLILIFQTVTGRFASAEGVVVWAWYMGLIFPAYVLLLIHIWQNRRPNKIIPIGVYRTLLTIVIGYLLIVFVSYFLFVAAIYMNDYGISDYLLSTLKFLLPLNLLILIGFWLIFLKKDSLFQPSSQALLQLAQQKAAEANARQQTLKLTCLECIASGNYMEAIEQMKAFFEKHHDPELNTVIILQGQLTQLKRDTDLHIVESAEAQIAYNRSILGLINVADSLTV